MIAEQLPGDLMGVLMRADCECGFTCTLITGTTWAGEHAPRFCATCKAYLSVAIPRVAPGQPERPLDCSRCGGATEPTVLDHAICPTCQRHRLMFWPVALVP